jgi:mannose/cellobiose epimerase-like protein (N-acyl-D-glucosamine 2-epimerase family)
MVQLEAALHEPPDWLVPAAVELFARAAADGLCYTTDWSGRPVVEERFHWVATEALMASDALGRRTRDPSYAAHSATWWDLADRHFLDRQHGSWHHELDPGLTVSRRTWDGKPDAFHIVNALLAPDLPLAPTAAAALSATGTASGPVTGP